MVANRFNLRKNIVSASLAFGVNIGLVFLSYKLIVISGGIQAVGLWSTLFAWTSLIRIGDVGMASATMRFTAMYDTESDLDSIQDYVVTGTVTNIALFGLLAAIGYFALDFFLADIVDASHVQEAHDILPLMFTGFFLMNLSSVILGALQGLHLGYLNARLTVVGNVLQIIIVVLLVPRLGLLGMAWAQVLQYALLTVVAWFVVRSKARIKSVLPIGFTVAVFKDMLKFSLKSQATNVTNGLFEPVSKILISHFGGLHVQGIYELAYKTLWLPRNAVIAGTSAMIPTLTSLMQTNPDRVEPLYAKSVRYSVLAVLVLSVAIVIVSPVISWLWVGTFEFQYTIFAAILAFGVVLNAAGASAYNLGIVTGAFRHNVVVNIFVLVFVVAAGAAVGYALPIYGLVVVISLALAIGGLAIKLKNERLLGDFSNKVDG